MPHKYQWLTPKELYAIILLQNQVFQEGFNLDKIINLIAHKCHDAIQGEGTVVELVEGEDLVYRAVAGQSPANLGLRVKLNNSLSGRAIKQRAILRCEDAETDDRVDKDACRKVGLRSMVVAPLYKDATIVGVLKVFSSQPNQFTEREQVMLEIMSQIISTAIYITEKYGKNQLYIAATTDMMTGIRNRAYFYDVLHSSFITARETHHPFLVIMTDMDGLKAINDGLGHRYGDAAIIEFTQRIIASLRNVDVFARLGGDEFGILINSVSGVNAAQQVIERLERALGSPFMFDEQPIPLSASFGVVAYHQDVADITQLLDEADKKMYANKKVKKQLSQ